MINFKFGKEHRTGGQSQPKPQFGPTAQIIGDLKAPLKSALYENLIGPGAFATTGKLAEREIQQATQAVRGGYAARGLAGSGIAQAGEQQASSDISQQVGQQYAQNLIGVASLGTGGPSYAPQQQPRGLFGLK